MEKENKPLKITEIANGMKKNHSTIRKYLDILTNLKLIKIEKVNGRILFRLDVKKYFKIRKSIQGE